MYNSEAFSTLIVVCKTPLLSPKLFHHHQNKSYMPVSSLPSYPQSLKNSDLISISIDLLILDISYKWNHMLRGLLRLASLTEHHALKAQPPCREYQCFSPFHSWNIFHLDHWSFHTFSVFLCSCCSCCLSLFLLTHSVVSDSLQLHELQDAGSTFPCPSLSPGVCSNSCPLSQRCHPTISSSVTPFSSCPQSFRASGSFPMSRLFVLGGQNIGTSVFLPHSIVLLLLMVSFLTHGRERCCDFNSDWRVSFIFLRIL